MIKSKTESFHGYYYYFEATGHATIDAVLREVAIAGKMFHNTEQWNDELPGFEDPRSPQQRIQNAANNSSTKLAALLAACDHLLSLDTRSEKEWDTAWTSLSDKLADFRAERSGQ